MLIAQELETRRDSALAGLSPEEFAWLIRQLEAPDRQALLRRVGLRLNPKHLKSSIAALVQTRLQNVPNSKRWELVSLLTKPCLREFERELGIAFESPTEQQLRAAIPTVETRCGAQLVRLTLLISLHREAKASHHILAILSDQEPRPEFAKGSSLGGDDAAEFDAASRDLEQPEALALTAPRSAAPPEISPSTRAPVERVPIFIGKMIDRVNAARSDSDSSHYTALLLLGEMLTKISTLSLIASINGENDESQIAYAKQFNLVRADGIGLWSQSIQDLTTAPVYRLLHPSARDFHTSMTQRFSRESDVWQRRAIDLLAEASGCFPALATDPGKAQSKVSLAQWFQLFAALRNKTRGHGADLISWQSSAAKPLRQSIFEILNNLECLTWQWWNIRRNAGGVPKARLLAPGDLGTPPFDPYELPDGTYVVLGPTVQATPLLGCSVDLDDFYLPNGDANETKLRHEVLSYISGSKRWGDLRKFVRPPRELPRSETHGSAELRAVGNVLTNIPETKSDYVDRSSLEAELHSVLTDLRHPVVAINGPGGIGKTSLALRVLHELAEYEAFNSILWFSARDIDLDPARGPLAVQPGGQSLIQFARQYWSYVEPARLSAKPDEVVEDFLTSLTENEIGPVLYVFDNFETVHNPPQLFREISEFTRLPNKVLITTRHREFKGDWPLDVDGMTREEFDSLVRIVGSQLQIEGLMAQNTKWITSLFEESGGHPYVVKVALGEVARTRKTPQKFERIMASRDEILDALFERSFNRLDFGAQRVFFTLCKWRARIPAIALEAVMTRPANPRIDVRSALQHLEDSSLIERAYSEIDAESFLHVPAAAYRFGIGQLSFSDLAPSVDEDARFLHLFGAVSDNVTKTGFSSHVHRYYDNASALPAGDLEQAIAIGEYVSRRYPESWAFLARLQMRAGPQARVAAKRSLQSYLARRPDDSDVWLELGSLCLELNDGLGELRAAANASAYAERRYGGLSESLRAIRERVESGRLNLDSRQKREFVSQLCAGWHPRENQATVGDCYNLGKLAERADDADEALFWAERGLRKDRNNQRLLEIKRRAYAVVNGRPS